MLRNRVFRILGWIKKWLLGWASQMTPRTTQQNQASRGQEAGEPDPAPFPSGCSERATSALPWSLILPPSLHHSAPSKALHEPFYLAELNHTIASQQHRGQEMRVLLFYFFILWRNCLARPHQSVASMLQRFGAYTDVSCQQEGTFLREGV